MAVELCKVSLWMEAIEPGKPLSFLDAHIQCGNSLLGTTPALLSDGIPDAAFEPIEGDDKKICSEFKKLKTSFSAKATSVSFREDRPDAIWETQPGCTMLIESEHSLRRCVKIPSRMCIGKGRLYQTTWSRPDPMKTPCSGPTPGAPPSSGKRPRRCAHPSPTKSFRDIGKQSIYPGPLAQRRNRASRPTIPVLPLAPRLPSKFSACQSATRAPDNEQAGWSGGFDVVLGNPPWERIKIQEKEWFAAHRPDIANAANAAARRKMIAALQISSQPGDQELYAAFMADQRQATGESHFVHDSARYPLCGRGDVNTYAIYAEHMRWIVAPTGRVGCIVPSGIATDDTTKQFFSDLVESHTLANFYDFENREKRFLDVDSRYSFCSLTINGSASDCSRGFQFCLFCSLC